MIKITIYKDLQQVFGMIGGSAFFSNLNGEMKVFQFDTLYKKVNDADFVIRANDLIE